MIIEDINKIASLSKQIRKLQHQHKTLLYKHREKIQLITNTLYDIESRIRAKHQRQQFIYNNLYIEDGYKIEDAYIENDRVYAQFRGPHEGFSLTLPSKYLTMTVEEIHKDAEPMITKYVLDQHTENERHKKEIRDELEVLKIKKEHGNH